ncbi:MAG: glycine oxidase [Gammaproteobacteria bacterium]|jgi:glycine oxidase
MEVSIIGAGVAGLTAACELVDRGVSVTIYEQSEHLGGSACSWFAGGMLAPWSEQESADQTIVDLGVQALDWWGSHVDNLQRNGSLVLSMQRDKRDIQRFARLTSNHVWLDGDQIAQLESDLSGSFERGLFYKDEAHLDARQALQQLAHYLSDRGIDIQFGQAVNTEDCHGDFVIDSRGFSARQSLPQLCGVKGEMLLLKTQDIKLNRAVRLVHPRNPLYIVPRDDGLFMVGATMIENDERNRITARSMLELLSAAYALHPAFGEEEIVEIGVDVRPAFDDNLPRLLRNKNTLYINGLYRHGFFRCRQDDTDTRLVY